MNLQHSNLRDVDQKTRQKPPTFSVNMSCHLYYKKSEAPFAFKARHGSPIFLWPAAPLSQGQSPSWIAWEGGSWVFLGVLGLGILDLCRSLPCHKQKIKMKDWNIQWRYVLEGDGYWLLMIVGGTHFLLPWLVEEGCLFCSLCFISWFFLPWIQPNLEFFTSFVSESGQRCVSDSRPKHFERNGSLQNRWTKTTNEKNRVPVSPSFFFWLGGSIDRSLGRVLLGKCWSRLEVFARQQWLRFAQGTIRWIQRFFKCIQVSYCWTIKEGEFRWVSFLLILVGEFGNAFFKEANHGTRDKCIWQMIIMEFRAIDFGSQVDPNKNLHDCCAFFRRVEPLNRCCDSPDCKWTSEGLNFED